MGSLAEGEFGTGKGVGMNKGLTMGIVMLGCLAAGVVCLSQSVHAADTKATDAPASAAITKLLGVAKAQAYLISVDATLLQSYTRSDLDWRTHAKEITRVKNHINAAAKTVTALDAARNQAAPWQVTAINRILPYMREMAEDTTNAIEYINKNQSRLNEPEYKEYIEANSDTSRELSDLIAQFVDYGNNKGNYDKLQKKLELPAK
jgi:hypothetical protein